MILRASTLAESGRLGALTPAATAGLYGSLPSAAAEAASSQCALSAATAAPAAATAAPKRVHWSLSEMMLFYEGIKQFGKDYDALYNFMSKRKAERDKEQLRNFFFNFYKMVRQSAGIKEDEWPPEISRDARDLFVVVNGCEWKKRMDNCKYDQPKLRSLILEGACRVRYRKQFMTIKTPPCPSILQFFSFNKRITRFPADLILYLSPRSIADGVNVTGRGQSKHLCIRVNLNDRLERLFELMHLKWRITDRDYFSTESADEEPAHEQRPFTVRLFPSRDTLMGDVTYSPSPHACGNISILRLCEDRRQTENVKRKIKKGDDVETTACYTASQSLLPLLSITRQMLQAGLTKESAGAASIAELYAVCGLSREITLLYAIEEKTDEEEDELWQVMVQLLKRGYGLVEKRTTGGKTPSREESSAENGEEEATAIIRKPRPLKRPAPMPPAQLFMTTQSPIVSEEIDEFEEQLRSLADISKRMVKRRRSPVRIRIVPSFDSYAVPKRAVTGTRAPPTAAVTIVDNRECGSSAYESTKSNTMDWSHRIVLPVTAAEASPPTSFPQAHSIDVAGDDDVMGRALRAAFTSPGNTLMEAPSTSAGRRSGDRLFYGSPAKSTTAHTHNTSLPLDVHQSMELMLSQNSLDYCLNFAQLINHTTIGDSPAKMTL